MLFFYQTSYCSFLGHFDDKKKKKNCSHFAWRMLTFDRLKYSKMNNYIMLYVLLR